MLCDSGMAADTVICDIGKWSEALDSALCIQLWWAETRPSPAPLHSQYIWFSGEKLDVLFPNTAKLTANLQRAHWAESCLGRLSPQLGGSKEKWVALNTAPGPAEEQQEAISALAPCQHRGRAGRGLAMSPLSSLYPG